MPSQIIQWFPGHMAKTRRLISDNLKNVDAIIEMRDARIPLSSKNPEIERLIQGKPRIILLNKASLADEKQSAFWIGKLNQRDTVCILTDCSTGLGLSKIPTEIQRLCAAKLERYAEKGMMLLRNRFFKSCVFNTNLRKWFEDNNITELNQLNGYTNAKSIDDIKLVVTESSIKYLKFGTLDEWRKNIDSNFGVVKTDKPTHFFDGQMVQTSYQLINTLNLSEEEVSQLLEDSFDYLKQIHDCLFLVQKHSQH